MVTQELPAAAPPALLTTIPLPAPPTPLTGRVFVTGGAGFLGRALIRRAKREGWNCRFLVFSRDEEKHRLVRERYGTDVECYLGDVRDYHALTTLMMGCETVIHAAAVKFVPDAEQNVWDTAKVNIDGIRNVVRAAAQCRIRRLVFISTDKACAPQNVYGMTKALGERLVGEANRWREPIHTVSVRYGNVIGSTGSLLPMFAEQRAKYGKLRVTDREMTRFWLSPDDAVNTILVALDEAERSPGAVVVTPAPAMRIYDIAQAVGGPDTPIEITGLRAGEKIHEHLVLLAESARVREQGGFYVLKRQALRADGPPWEYRSDAPVRWLTPEELLAITEDARTI